MVLMKTCNSSGSSFGLDEFGGELAPARVGERRDQRIEPEAGEGAPPLRASTDSQGQPMSEMIHEEVLKSQVLWEQDLEERWRAKELLKSTTTSEEARRHAQERLMLAPLAPPPSMQWALRIKKPLPSHRSPSVVAPTALLRSIPRTSREHA
jgi:hypothetical protein